VAEHFSESFDDPYGKFYDFGNGYKSQTILKSGEGEHSYANLWLANAVNLTRSGVRLQNISLSEMCTKCRQDLFFSHRGSNGKRGVMSGFIMMEA
jgi:copper oxidase (laccase) domain-containing protein